MIRIENVEVPAGDKLNLHFKLYDESDLPLLIPGGSAVWKLATAVNAATALATKDTAGTLVLVLVGGVYQVTVPIVPADTKSLAPKIYYHELRVKDASGDPSTVFGGRFIVLPTLIGRLEP